MTKVTIKTSALIIQNNKILLIKELNDHNKKYCWNLIKGTFDGEKDRAIKNTIQRECIEEINAKIKIKKLLNTVYYRDQNNIRVLFNFLCSLENKNVFLNNQKIQKSYKENIKEIKFFTKNEIKKIKRKDFMNEAIYISIQNFIKKQGKKELFEEIINL